MRKRGAHIWVATTVATVFFTLAAIQGLDPGAPLAAESKSPGTGANDHAGHDHEKAGVHDDRKGEHPGEKSRAGHGDPKAAKGHAAEKSGPSGKDEHADHEDEQVVRLGEAEIKHFGIEVFTAAPGNLENQLNLPGEVAINTDRQTHIVPRIPGVVKEVRKSLGDTVKQDEVMAVIQSRELADAKAEYLAAVEKTELARAKFSREERLWKKKISSEQEYLDAKQGLAESRIALRTAKQKLHALGLSHEHLKQISSQADLAYTRFEITAPFDSTVIEKHISLGEMLKDDSEAFTVADLSTMWVNLNVHQKDLVRVRKGQRVIIALDQEGEATEGQIAFVEPVVKADTRTALARVVVPNSDGRWHPGMFVTAKVLTDNAKAPIVIPAEAVQNLGQKTVVFIRTQEGFEPRDVRTGRSTESDVEILSGLSAGERYAGKGTLTLKAQLSKGEFGGHSH